MSNFIVYDTEIVKCIPTAREPRIEGIEYCHGWTDYKGMGVSVLVAYDARTKKTRVFLEDNLPEFQKLVDEVDRVIGFNNFGFDDPLVSAMGINIPKEKSRDLMRFVQVSAGYTAKKRVKGFKLDDICRVNGIVRKTEGGALAPIMWQRGQRGRVIDYCANDVFMTVEVLRLAHKGTMKNPITKEDMSVSLDDLLK